MLSISLLMALLLHPVAPASPEFGPGSYMLEQRAAAAANPYAGTRLDFLEGGYLVWNREGKPYAMMHWGIKGDLLTIEDADLCPTAPLGLYRVVWMERGFATEKISDDCRERASSAATLLLVPVRE